jgi:hypothetical protein
MPTHVTRNRFLVLALLLPLAAFGQDAPAPAPAPAAPASPSQAPSATGLDGVTSSALDYLYNHKAGEGTGAKAGADVASALADKIKAVDVLKTPGLDDPQVRARFETYLSLKEVPDDRIQEYFGKMDQISDTLKAGDIFGAWKMLYDLGQYQDLDAGISREVAARVQEIWETDQTKNSLEMANTQLQNNIDTADHNADLDAADLHYQQSEDNAKQQGKGNSNSSSNPSESNTTNSPLTMPNADPVAAEASLLPQMSGSMQGMMDMTSEYYKMLEARAKIRLNEIKEDKMSDQDRENFSDYIRTLYNSHRYYHVIIAADFYRAIFNQGDYPDDITNQAVASAGTNARQGVDSLKQVGQSLGVNQTGAINAINQLSNLTGGNTLGTSGQSDQPLSIADEVTASLEINNRVGQAIEVFRYKADKGNIASAAEELQEAFLGNEYHPALQGLPRDEKEKVGEFLDKLDVLKNQLEVRDFEQVEGQIDDIKKVATDFDSTKPMALVNGIKLESRLRLGKARLLAQGGHLTEAMQEFQTAAEEWPGNPDLQTSASGFFSTEDLQNQSTTEFDRLVQEQNYREIFDKQIAFAPAIKGDAVREQQLKDALEKVQKAEMAEEKANMLVMNGDVDGAWETIELASKDWPDDNKLNKLLADLSERSAEFVSALDKAQDAEAKKELGYSLTWYVNAQNIYPGSGIAHEGIDRVSKQILSPGTDAAVPQEAAPAATN